MSVLLLLANIFISRVGKLTTDLFMQIGRLLVHVCTTFVDLHHYVWGTLDLIWFYCHLYPRHCFHSFSSFITCDSLNVLREAPDTRGDYDANPVSRWLHQFVAKRQEALLKNAKHLPRTAVNFLPFPDGIAVYMKIKHWAVFVNKWRDHANK